MLHFIGFYDRGSTVLNSELLSCRALIFGLLVAKLKINFPGCTFVHREVIKFRREHFSWKSESIKKTFLSASHPVFKQLITSGVAMALLHSTLHFMPSLISVEDPAPRNKKTKYQSRFLNWTWRSEIVSLTSTTYFAICWGKEYIALASTLSHSLRILYFRFSIV